MHVCLFVSLAFLSTLNPGIIEMDPYFKKYIQTCKLASFFAGSHGFPMLQMGSCYIFLLNRSGIITFLPFDAVLPSLLTWYPEIIWRPIRVMNPYIYLFLDEQYKAKMIMLLSRPCKVWVRLWERSCASSQKRSSSSRYNTNILCNYVGGTARRFI